MSKTPLRKPKPCTYTYIPIYANLYMYLSSHRQQFFISEIFMFFNFMINSPTATVLIWDSLVCISSQMYTGKFLSLWSLSINFMSDNPDGSGCLSRVSCRLVLTATGNDCSLALNRKYLKVNCKNKVIMHFFQAKSFQCKLSCILCINWRTCCSEPTILQNWQLRLTIVTLVFLQMMTVTVAWLQYCKTFFVVLHPLQNERLDSFHPKYRVHSLSECPTRNQSS